MFVSHFYFPLVSLGSDLLWDISDGGNLEMGGGVIMLRNTGGYSWGNREIKVEKGRELLLDPLEAQPPHLLQDQIPYALPIPPLLSGPEPFVQVPIPPKWFILTRIFFPKHPVCTHLSQEVKRAFVLEVGSLSDGTASEKHGKQWIIISHF